MQSKSYYVYILTNYTNTTLYCGVTNNILRRVYEHKENLIDEFTRTYSIDKLVYYEEYNDAETAIAREKQIKGGSRKKKVELIRKDNPDFIDLYTSLV